MDQPCLICSDQKAHFRCEECHVAVYCGNVCQSTDWPIHQLLCTATLQADMENGVPFVLVTAPHAVCPAVGCDKSSAETARMFNLALNAVGLSHVVLLAETGRDVCDVARAWCRNMPLRVRARELAQRVVRDGRRLVAVDIHSFGRDAFLPYARRAEVVFLDGADGTSAAAALTSAGIRAYALSGASRANDLQREMRETFGANPAILFEVADALTTSRRGKVVKEMAKWLKNRLL